MKIGLHLHPQYKTISKSLPEIVAYLILKNQQVLIPEFVSSYIQKNNSLVEFVAAERIPDLADAMFSIGGDGSYLGASRLMAKTGKPVLGIHLGGLGFLSDISMENYKERITAFLEGDYIVEERSVLNAEISFTDHREAYFAFNDFVIDKGHVLTMIKIRTYVDDDYFNTYRSDGLIIATPTGSTAYSLSAGGPIISPHINVIAITPICPHSLSARPVILSDNQTIRIDCTEMNNDVSLIIDGQNRISLEKANTITINKADFSLKIVRFKGDTFFKTLRSKMNWGLDVRGN
ncbi:MAG: NAD(+)/NADH kinase [Candidatus Marinimicrobia bacterium]|nr:NAD(+)/NADH kinase [Candidatus Neomarinimicrobiota bacterium]